MTMTALSPDTQATALLVGRFGKGEVKPLTRGDYNKVANTLHVRKLRPSDLFKDVPSDLPVERSRIAELIGRGTSLALAVERWSQFGIGIVSRADSGYPTRFRALRGGAAPILFYAGDLGLLDTATLGVVGSRDATASGLRFAARLGKRAASEDVAIASGDARGVDRAAMDAAFDAGGKVIGILADSLAKSALSKRYRHAIGERRLLLISHVEPEARFTVPHAMERNRYIYAASDAVIIGDSDVKGGTWSGAIENDKHGWTTAYVRIGNEARDGNAALVQEGLPSIDDAWLESSKSLRSLFIKSARSTSKLPLFELSAPLLVPDVASGGKDALFELFVEVLEKSIEEPLGTQELAERLSLEPAQAAAWLDRAAALGRIARGPDDKWDRC
jgi:predicted Rossmann fold nucleotide-binding protein DprA/Smf involved in DNA uptake